MKNTVHLCQRKDSDNLTRFKWNITSIKLFWGTLPIFIYFCTSSCYIAETMKMLDTDARGF